MRSRSLASLAMAIALLGCSSTDGSGGDAGNDGATQGDSASSETTDARADGADAASDSSTNDATTDGDGGDASTGCAPPTTTWVQQTTQAMYVDGEAHVAYDCDAVYTLAPNASKGFWLQSWSQTDGSAGWKVAVLDGANPDGGALVRAGDGLFFVMKESANLEKHDPKTGATVWQKTEPDVHAFCRVAANDTTLFTTTEVKTSTSGSYTYRLDARSIADGSVVWSAATDESFCNGGTLGHMDGLVVTPDGIFTAGYNVERRSLVDGSLVWTTYKSENAVAFAVGDASVYVAGSFDATSPGYFAGWDVAQYDLATGTLGWEQQWNSSTTGSASASMASFAHGALFVGGFERTMTFTPTEMRWDVDRLDPATGKLTWGRTFTAPTISSCDPTDGASDGASVYFVGVGDGDALRIEKRHVSDGKY